MYEIKPIFLKLHIILFLLFHMSRSLLPSLCGFVPCMLDRICINGHPPNMFNLLTGPIVQTKHGALKGEFMRAKGKDTVIHSYLGVPFAKPPVGPLRLSAPQPAEQWQGVRDATKQPYM